MHAKLLARTLAARPPQRAYPLPVHLPQPIGTNRRSSRSLVYGRFHFSSYRMERALPRWPLLGVGRFRTVSPGCLIAVSGLFYIERIADASTI